MKMLFHAFVFFSLAVSNNQSTVSFIHSDEKVKCKCYLEKNNYRTHQTYVFHYALEEKKVGSANYYLAESNFFAWKKVYLREENQKVFLLFDVNADERVLLDFSLSVGDTLKYHNSEYALQSKKYNLDLSESIYRFELSKQRGTLSHSCIASAFEVTKKRGYVRLEYKCGSMDSYYCLIKPLRR